MFAVNFSERVLIPEIMKPIVDVKQLGWTVEDCLQFTVLPKSLRLAPKTDAEVCFELYVKVQGENKPFYVTAPSVDDLYSITAY